MMKKRFSALLLSACMCIPCTACLDLEDSEISEEMSSVESTVEEPSAEDKKGENSVTAQQPDAGPTIQRRLRSSTAPMGEENTWTVFVYLCGSDLESKNNMASMDMDEMAASAANDNIRFVVQTGGSYSWDNTVDPDESQRYLIANGETKLVGSSAEVNMGKSSTLSDFLSWGIAEYPAANMGLILWDHGSGSINGVCFDELHDDDSLLLKDVDAALHSVYDQMTEPFEFIGMDACLMATAEAAALFASHAKYMVASQENEPGYGWDYTALGNYLAENPAADGLACGKFICDSFYDSCAEYDSEDSVTLSVTDLSRIDAFIVSFDKYAEELYQIVKSSGDFSDIARDISDADNFGGNNFLSGYTNMVDTAGIISAGKAQCSNAAAAISELQNAVVYCKNGSDHADACGLSMYYPLQLQGSEELSIFKDVAISAYYLGLVDKIAYGAAGDGDIFGYDNSDILSLFSNFFGLDDYEESDGNYTYEQDDYDTWEYADDFSAGEYSVEFEEEPALDEDGNYSFMLTEESLMQTDYVEASVDMLADGEVIELGYTGEVYQDWESGFFSDIFDGYWFSLPDDQHLAVYLYEECDGYDIYLSPVEVNGEEVYLRFRYDYEDTEVSVIDIWDGESESGASGRFGQKLEAGDIIVPLYSAYTTDDEEEFQYYGEEYEYDGDPTLWFTPLPDGEYIYSFCINSIYGDYCFTDPVSFAVKDEEIYFEATA